MLDDDWDPIPNSANINTQNARLMEQEWAFIFFTINRDLSDHDQA